MAFSIFVLRLIVGAIFADSAYEDLKDPAARSKSITMPIGFTIFLGVAEAAGALGIITGILASYAAIGLILLMLGAIAKKVFEWKTGFWGKESPGWYYEVLLIATLLVIAASGGGDWVL